MIHHCCPLLVALIHAILSGQMPFCQFKLVMLFNNCVRYAFLFWSNICSIQNDLIHEVSLAIETVIKSPRKTIGLLIHFNQESPCLSSLIWHLMVVTVNKLWGKYLWHVYLWLLSEWCILLMFSLYLISPLAWNSCSWANHRDFNTQLIENRE